MTTVHEPPLVETRVDDGVNHDAEEVKLLYDIPPEPVSE
jgi:hypothetical protein